MVKSRTARSIVFDAEVLVKIDNLVEGTGESTGKYVERAVLEKLGLDGEGVQKLKEEAKADHERKEKILSFFSEPKSQDEIKAGLSGEEIELARKMRDAGELKKLEDGKVVTNT